MVRLPSHRVLSSVWKAAQQQAQLWRIGAMPGLVVVGCVVLARSLGTLQTLEWGAYDYGLQSRPLESPDPRIVIVGIDENDVRRVGSFPIPDLALAQLIRTVASYQPRVIGLDIFRDLTNTPGRAELARVFKTTPNLIGIEVSLPSDSSRIIKPPPELPPERLGLTDALIDPDGKFRRQLLVTKVDSGAIRYSWALQLAKYYLQQEGVQFQRGDRASQPVNFNPTGADRLEVGHSALPPVQLPRFTQSSGGYTQAQAIAGGNQLLLSFRSHPQPFTVVSLTDVVTGKVKPAQIRDRLVLIGMVNASSNDTFMTSAIKGSILTQTLGLDPTRNYQSIYGVEINAHAVSEIISAVLDQRSPMRSWDDIWEYLWIITWGVGGIGVGLFFQSPWKTLLGLGSGSLLAIALGQALLVQNLWIPVVPTVMALIGAGLTTAFFDQRAKALLEQRSLTLKRTYDAVHNGPLQTLAAILRSDLPSERVRTQLQGLNQELRSVYEAMNQSLLATAPPTTQASLPDLLYQVYDTTLKRDLPGFATIKTYIPPDFSSLADCFLSMEHKQSLCVFLEEALCNVGKHAVDATYLDVVCDRDHNGYRLCVIDNGRLATHTPVSSSHPTPDTESPNFAPGFPTRRAGGTHPIDRFGQSGRRQKTGAQWSTGWGTTQAQDLARQLHGQFSRRIHPPQGIACELRWGNPRVPWLSTLEWLKTKWGHRPISS
jgi:CHASE2 domain-containing sensor protein/two-component sensor histidine kinase